MKMYLEVSSSKLTESAKQLSSELNLNLADSSNSRDSKHSESDYFFVLSEERVFLRKGLNKNSKPIFSDFDRWTTNFNDKLLKSCFKGLPSGFLCLDLTAGFGKDAFEISKLDNCKSIKLVEKELWLLKVIENGIQQSKRSDTNNFLSKFKLICQDNFIFLENLKDRYDVIYIDPMFFGVSKAKAKRHMQALRDLELEETQEGLLRASLHKAKKRVIVKRHKNMPFLDDIAPQRSVKGKVVRYDIYQPN